MNRRIEGLKNAIAKMNQSISRDNKELTTLLDKVNSSNTGQIETQLSELRAKIIKDRINSKNDKLVDMNQTLTDLENKLKRRTK